MKGIAKRQLTPVLYVVILWCNTHKIACDIFGLETSFFIACLNIKILIPHKQKSPVTCSGRSTTSRGRLYTYSCLSSLGLQFLEGSLWLMIKFPYQSVLWQAGMHTFCLCRWKSLCRKCLQGGRREEVHHHQQVGNCGTGAQLINSEIKPNLLQACQCVL